MKNAVIYRNRFMLFGSVIGLTLSLGLYAQSSEYLDPKNWVPIVSVNNYVSPNPSGIVANEGALSLLGYYSSINIGNDYPPKTGSYALKSNLAKNFENKLVEFTVVFDGEFPDPILDNSNLSFGLRGDNPNNILWQQNCYCVLFAENKFVLRKYGKGTQFDPSDFTFPYSKFPELGFVSFPKQKEIKIALGVINEGPFPRIIVKINGIEVLNKIDNKNGLTIKSNPNNVFTIALVGTNKRVAGDETSHSSLTIKSVEIK